jgi:CheY-like chemotaxis protein
MIRILLVEDNEMNRDMLLRRLERRGFAVSIALDGAEGIVRARAEIPDVILMDMSLPVMDGYHATRLLKEDPLTRAIPILGLSAHAMTGDAERALEAGCDDYDTKPVELKRLLAKIDQLLGQRGAQSLDAAREGAPASASRSEPRGASEGALPPVASHPPAAHPPEQAAQRPSPLPPLPPIPRRFVLPPLPSVLAAKLPPGEAPPRRPVTSGPPRPPLRDREGGGE